MNAEAQRIAEFWHWWQHAGATGFAAAIEARDMGPLDEMNHLVSAIDEDLQWELGPGRSGARHTLCVTGAGNPKLRPITERWLRAAPLADGTWEYASARRADLDALQHQLKFGDWEVDLSLARVSLMVQEQSLLIDVTVFHPAFAEMPEQDAWRIAYLMLDWTLGEDDVERWVGEIAITGQRPADALPVDALPETTRALAARHPEPTWVIMEGQGQDGARLMAVAMRPLRWIDHPLLDLHVAVTLTYPQRDPRDLPDGDALTELRELEDSLTEFVGSRALLVAHETGRGGRDLHLYCDSTDHEVVTAVQRWVDQRPRASLQAQPDPAWEAVRHLR